MWYKVDLELILVTPVHIGHLRYGFINKTKLYIPYYIIHSAINKLLYLEHKRKNNKELFVATTFMFYEDNTLLDQIDIRKRYIFSTTSTAIDNKTRTARENSLHNIEFISPEPVFGNNKSRLKAKGNLFVKKEFYTIISEVLKKYGNHLYIGGELKYGYGKTKVEVLNFSDTDKPTVNVSKGDFVKELVKVDDHNSLMIDGEKELIFLRKTRNFERHGSWTWYEGLFFSPFSISNADGEIDLTVRKISVL